MAGRAVVIVARRSEPPCFSVIAMPTVTAALLLGVDRPLIVGRLQDVGRPLVVEILVMP